jgi:hypothetical protein
MKNELNVKLIGQVTITDVATGEIVLKQRNAVHPQNMATLISRSIAKNTNGTIFKMGFGNGGTFINSSLQIVYRPPNTIGSATLYNETYNVQVDEQSAGTPETNTVTASASPSPAITSVVTVTAMLLDGIPTDPYTFDELGLMTEDNLLLSHLTFTPVAKTTGSAKLIVYEILISVS